MGGYAPYVWGAYGLSALVVAALVGLSWRRLRAAERALRLAEEVRHRHRAAERADAPANQSGGVANGLES